MTQDRSLATLQGARDALLSSSNGKTQPAKRPQVGLGFMKIKFTSDNNRKVKRNPPLTQTKKSRLPCVYSEVMTSLKSNKDRQLDKELHDINIRKRNREVEHFLSQRQFFIDRVFNNKNELRFSRYKNQGGSTTPRVQSCPQFSSSTTDSDLSLSPTITSLTPGTSLTPPSLTPTVHTSGTVGDQPRSQPTPRSSSKTKKDKPALILRDLLFLEESEEPPTPNRQRILQARARMFPSTYSNNKKRPITAPGSGTLDRKQEVELPAITNGGKEGRHVRFQNKMQVRRTKSEGVVRTNVETGNEDSSDTTPTCSHDRESTTHTCNHATSPACSSHGNSDTSPTCHHVDSTTCNHDATQLEDLEASINTAVTSQRQQGMMLTTPTPRPDGPGKVSWSSTIVESQHATTASEGRAAKHRFKARRAAAFNPPEPTVDLEAHERMLQRIMVTIPPDIIAKATANAQNMSDLMGYTEQREQLLKQERRHGQRLDMADTRFVRLLELLKN